MMTLFCYKIDAPLLANYAKELSRNDLELTPITDLSQLSAQDFLLTNIEAIADHAFLPKNSVLLFRQSLLTDLQKDQLLKLCEQERIFGHINTELPALFYRPFFNQLGNTANQRQNLLRLAGLGQELDQLTEQTKREITQIKKLHEKIIPVRNEVHKGLTIHSKYAAGSGGGGEFFDFHQENGEFLFILSASTSYLMTSAIITRLEYLRSTKLSKDSIRQMIEGIFDDVNSLEIRARGKRNALDLTVIHVDLKRMTLSGNIFGDGIIVGKTDYSINIPRDLPRSMQFIEQSSFSFPLQRGERLVFLSAGVYHNGQGILDKMPLNKFVQNKLELSSKELLNELFYQLKKDLSGDFLNYDASAISIEVDKNAIFQI